MTSGARSAREVGSIGLRVASPGALALLIAVFVDVPVTSTAAALVVAALLAQRRAIAERGLAMAAAGGAMATAIPLAVLAFEALGRPIDLRPQLFGPPSMDPDADLVLGLVFLGLLFVLSMAGALAGHALHSRASVARRAAGIAVVAAALLLGLALQRARRLPDADELGPLAAVPVVGTLPPVSEDRIVDESTNRRVHVASVGAFTATRTCAQEDIREGHRCALHLRGPGSDFELAPGPWTVVHFRTPEGNLPVPAPLDLPMTVRHEPRRDLWFVEAGGRILLSGSPRASNMPVLRCELSRYLAWPRAWTLAAAVATILALVELVRSRARGELHAITALVVVVLGATPLAVTAGVWLIG